MQEQLRLAAFEEELQDRAADAKIQIERPVDELELARPSIQQPLHRREKLIEVGLPDGNVERRQTEFTGIRASARSFDVDHAVRDVLVGVKIVRKLQSIQLRQCGFNDSCVRRSAVQNRFAQRRERHIGFAADHKIGQSRNRLRISFVTDFRPADDDRDIRPHTFQIGDQPSHWLDIPDVDAQANDLRFVLKNRRQDVGGVLADAEFEHHRLIP